MVVPSTEPDACAWCGEPAVGVHEEEEVPACADHLDALPSWMFDPEEAAYAVAEQRDEEGWL